MHKKRFISLTLLTFLSGCSFTNQKPTETLAQINFPEQIEGAREIRKYEIPNSKKFFVHISQAHLSYNEQIPSEEVKTVQDNIEKIILDLKEKTNTNVIYLEGFTPRTREEAYRNRRIYEKEYLKRGYLEAGERLFYEGKIEIKEAEIPRTYLEGITAERELIDNLLTELREKKMEKRINPFSKEFVEKVYDNREDSAIFLASKNEEPLAVIIYGAKHCFGGEKTYGRKIPLGKRRSFRDNIYEWNKKNPKNKFSLIEIIPCGCEDFLSRQNQ